LTISVSKKTLKCLSTTLISLLLVSAFAAGEIVSVKAQAPTIVLWLVTTTENEPGYYGGYHDVWMRIIPKLKDILNIEVKWVQYKDFDWEDVVWDYGWNRTGDWDGNGIHDYKVDGWDLTMFEWWMNPNSYIWLDELVYSWGTPPTGWNIMSWNDTKADVLYRNAMTATTSDRHKSYLWKWQEEFMHNPPLIPVYYAELMTARAAYLENWDETAWLYDISQLDINEAVFDAVATAKRKEVGSNTVIWAAAEPVWTWFPYGTLTYTEETMNVLKQGMLYRLSREDLTAPVPPAHTGKFITKPALATAPPTWREITDPQQGGKKVWVATVPIKSGLTWTDGVEFNASDVAFSYNAILRPGTKSMSYGDYSYLLHRAEVVNKTAVDFVYKPGMGPDYDFAGYQSHGWALAILPGHQVKWDIKALAGQPYSLDPIPVSKGGGGWEVLGPYVPDYYNEAEGYIIFNKRPEYVNALGWSPTMPDRFMVKIIGEAGSRLVALQNLEADFIEYPTASLEIWEMIRTTPPFSDRLKVYTYVYPASHPVWIQHRNKILSNRFVRLAIAHAIPYDDIFREVLPGWGVAKAYMGKTLVVPWQEGFNTQLGNYEYNPEKAKMYMDMWRYSQLGEDATKGPVGDHNFSGLVDMLDYPIWVNNFGKTVAELPWWPSNNIDPDNNNDDFVDTDDIILWGGNVGNYYPFYGAW